MEGEDSGLYRLNVETLLAAAAQNQDFHDKDNEKSVGVSVPITEDSAPQKPYTVVKPPPQPPVVEQVIGLSQKRKRGRLTKGRKKEEEEEEDVCFICFDGGSLVLCDRKGCPKAYHPACIKRDEAFFRSKAKWNCGWHICIVCQKASHYMCYTCTYSLCKGCTKNADYVCVRGNKGFCAICMRTVMLIENKDQMNSESVQVDFDDHSSWEYLFKVYWINLKEKLSLTLSELTQAKNPCKEAGVMACKHPATDVHHNTHDGKVSILYRSSVHLDSSYPKGQLNLQNKKDPLSTEGLGISNDIDKLSNTKAVDDPSHNKGKDKSSTDEGTDKPSIDEGAEWASKDLLEFVSHMRNGDTSVLSQFDVQSLLLDYVKRNNLRDARSKSQIICDLRLKNLFGKPHVGHIEMLKLLEFHFLIKEESHNNAFIPAGFVVPVANDMEIDGNSYSSFMTSENRKRKTHKKGEERAPHTKLDVYAAIDVHNINLIYLRRNLMEGLIEDKEKFHDKVVGSIVRIRISSNDPKQDIYRLVQVIGTRKTNEVYEIGDRTSDFMLEVLNLDKKETILIDAISNQEFSEDESRRLRQSMRCGLVKQLTVGEIRKKAMALQEVRLNDLLEAEILSLNHLRDQASEKGLKKELRECIEKLELLKMPEERQRRLCEVLEIHADPIYESEEDAGGGKNHMQEYVRTRYTKFYQNVSKSMSPKKKGIELAPIEAQNRTCEKIDVAGSNSSEKHIGRVNITNSAIGGWSDQAKLRSGSESSTATVSMRNSPSANNSETEKLWHYRDPSGKIQGPFSMVQLRKWSTTGLFPPDMRIWAHNEHCKSLLLSDALNGQFHGISEFPYYISSKVLELGAVPDKRLLDGNSLGSENMNGDKYSISRTQYQMTSGCDHEDRSNNQSQVSQSSGEILRSLATDLSSNGKGARSDLTPLARSPDSSKEDGDIYISDRSSPTPTASCKDWEVQNAEKQQSASSDVRVQNSDILDLPSPTPSPSDEDQGDQATDTKPSLLVMNGATLPEIADKWCGYSPTPAKPSIVEWGNDLVPASSLKPPEAISGHAAILTSNRNQHTHSSQSHLLSDFPNCQGIVDEPIEFDALSVESVSDLLAEVDAMESRSDLASPTSAMKFCKELMEDFGKELIEDCKDYCFSSIEGFCQTPDPGRSNSSSSTGEIQLTCQPTVACEPVGGLAASQVHICDPFRSSGGHSSASSLGGKKSTDTPIYPGEARSEFHLPAPSDMVQDIVDTTMALSTGPGSIDSGWGTVQGNIKYGDCSG